MAHDIEIDKFVASQGKTLPIPGLDDDAIIWSSHNEENSKGFLSDFERWQCSNAIDRGAISSKHETSHDPRLYDIQKSGDLRNNSRAHHGPLLDFGFVYVPHDMPPHECCGEVVPHNSYCGCVVVQTCLA